MSKTLTKFAPRRALPPTRAAFIRLILPPANAKVEAELAGWRSLIAGGADA